MLPNLCRVPKQPTRCSAGRPRSYGKSLPTPEALRKDQSVPWETISICNGPHRVRYKHIARAKWHIAGEKALVQIVVIAPLAFQRSFAADDIVERTVADWRSLLAPREIPSPPEGKAYRSPFGVLHMGGNAAEWGYDRFGANCFMAAPTHAPQGPPQGGHRVFRGGSYLDEDEALTTYSRRHSGQQASFWRGLAANGRPMIGFRCARSIEPDAAGIATNP